MTFDKAEQYELGKELLENLIEEYGLVKGFKKYYKAVLTGDIQNAISD